MTRSDHQYEICIIYNLIRTGGMPSGPFSWCPHTAGGVKVCFHIMTPCEESMIQHLELCIVQKTVDTNNNRRALDNIR